MPVYRIYKRPDSPLWIVWRVWDGVQGAGVQTFDFKDVSAFEKAILFYNVFSLSGTSVNLTLTIRNGFSGDAAADRYQENEFVFVNPTNSKTVITDLGDILTILSTVSGTSPSVNWRLSVKFI